MSKQQKRKKQRLSEQWNVGMLLAIVAFFASISSGGLLNILHGSDNQLLDSMIFFGFGFIAIYIGDFVQFGLEKLNEVNGSSDQDFIKAHWKAKTKQEKIMIAFGIFVFMTLIVLKSSLFKK